MRALPSLLLACAGVALWSACSDSPAVVPPPATKKDAGMSSGNDDASAASPDAAAMGQADAAAMGGNDGGGGGNPDAGPPPPGCNPSDGSGCPMGQLCEIAVGGAAPACASAAVTPVQPGAACQVADHECPAGFSCLAGPGMADGACGKICLLGSDQCAMFTDQSGNPLICSDQVLDRATGYGVCAPDLMACVAYNDMCPNGQYCEVVSNEGNMACIPLAMMPAALGQACQPGGCARGGICVNLGGGGTCRRPCDPNGGAGCIMGEACTPLSGPNGMLPFGVCQATATCTPLMDNCPAGQMCQPVSQTAFGCGPEGTRMTGQSCGGANGQCRRGDLCAGMAGGGATCLRACDAATMCPAGTMCNMMAIPGANFGLCL